MVAKERIFSKVDVFLLIRCVENWKLNYEYRIFVFSFTQVRSWRGRGGMGVDSVDFKIL